MWLDRLAAGPNSASGASTPQSASRSFSPLPRRTSSNLSPYVTSQRQGHSPRGSSLSLVSSDSSVSLLAASRRPNGSGVRQSSALNDQAARSIDALDKLLRTGDGAALGDTRQSSLISDSDLEFDFDFDGLSLIELAATTKDYHPPGPALRLQSRDEYTAEETKFEELHKSIFACDDILGSVELNLASFRDDLAAVSADIESLQDRSTALNRRLENRQEIEKALAPIVEDLSISPETISKIATGTIDESWTKVLAEVDRRATSHKKAKPDSQRSKAAEDMGPLLEKLIQKAIERIRDFIVTQIKSLRSPQVNAQVIQQQSFLRYKDLFTFLHRHHAVLAEEIAQAYMNTMRWYYQTQFARYEKSLNKMKLHVIDKSDSIGYEESSRITNVLSVSRSSAPPHDAFNLGRRMDILKATNQPAVPSHLAEEDQTTHYLETPFRNFNLALIDNAMAEYTFMASYFSPALSFSKINKYFNYVLDPTFDLGRNLSKTLVSETYDAIAILLCIRLNQHSAFELQRRKVPAADGYINATNMLLWPRFQVVMDKNAESVKLMASNIPTKPAKSSSDASKLSAAPHMVTQRFGQLLHAILSLSAEGGDDEPVMASLQRLRTEVEAFLTRLSNTYGSDRRKSSRFMYNNYSLIHTIIADAKGKLAEEQQDHFDELKQAYQDED